MNTSSLFRALNEADIIVLSIFNRFGDGVIAATVCAEFVNLWKGKRFLVVTSPQLLPYLSLIFENVEVVALKKKSIIDWVRVWRLIKTGGKSVGLNPYSFGRESRRVISFANDFFCYKNTDDAFLLNYYDRVRRYLGIPLRGDFVSPQPLPDSINKVIFCPESSELRRSLSIENKSRLLHEIRRRWPGVKVTVAAKDGRYLRGDDEVVVIPLGKSRKDSLRFVKAIKDSDLVISVDAGPLHIAAALNVFVLGVFSSAHPLTVINVKTRAAVLRSGLLNNAYCELVKCTKPRCMDGLSLDQVILKFDAKAVRRVAYDHCPAGYSDSEVL